MKMRLIDMDTWARKECFSHFMSVAQSTYSITVNMDITRLLQLTKERGYRLYPVFTWIVARALNRHEEFRMGYDEKGRLGIYDAVYPDYAVLEEKTRIMNSLCTPYEDGFAEFYGKMVRDLEAYKEKGTQTPKYPNFFVASCLPWIHYTSFTASNESNYAFLFPMVTWGKYIEVNDQALMPVTLQIHHAVADGYHCSLFFADVEEVLKTPELFLQTEGNR